MPDALTLRQIVAAGADDALSPSEVDQVVATLREAALRELAERDLVFLLEEDAERGRGAVRAYLHRLARLDPAGLSLLLAPPAGSA